MDDDDKPVEMGNLDIYEGDVSMVLRANGEVEFLLACEDEESEMYLVSLDMVHYLKFVLESGECRDLFEKSLQETQVLN